ncbi:hypothetical protein SUDANB105_00469 [Streptomyces sp. enrichment culture]|uniref:hypothetical protein n=1 Tax=Streptomyces sp. enrichment culture TaxID=1795815 RepID=UPI003F579BEF
MAEGSATAGSAASEIEALRASADAPGARVLQIAQLLHSLSQELTTHHHVADAVDAQQAAVDVLRTHPPTAAGELADHRFTLAMGLHHLAIRLWTAQRDTDALAPAREAVSGYRHAAATPGTTNFLKIAQLLHALSHELTTHHHIADAVDATAQRASICLQHADDAHLEAALADLAGLYERAPGLRVMRAVIASSDANLLVSVMHRHSEIISEQGVRRGPGGMPRVACYASNETLDLLPSQGITVDILADATTERLSQRDVNLQANRFADGSIPAGVGELI